MAAWTKDVNGVVSGEVGESYGEDWLALAEDMGASSKGCRSVLFVHGVHSPVCDNVSSMD